MKPLRVSSAFKKDLKRELSKPHGAKTIESLRSFVELLLEDKPLPARARDHALGGPLKGLRDCHVRPDLVLLYERPDPKTLRLVRLGSPADLFG